MSTFANRGWKVLVVALAVALIPTAAYAVIGGFSSHTAAPAVTATNSSSAAGTKAIEGQQTGGGSNTRYGVLGTANGAGGIGVIGTGTQDGIFSNGPLGVRAGSTLQCTGCVSENDLAPAAQGVQPLVSGQSQSGAFGTGGGNTTSGYIGEGITYVRPLPAAIPNANIIPAPTWPVPHCNGPGSADPGYLCLYESVISNIGVGYGFSTALGNGQSVGVILFWPVAGTGSYVGGAWTVTAA